MTKLTIQRQYTAGYLDSICVSRAYASLAAKGVKWRQLSYACLPGDMILLLRHKPDSVIRDESCAMKVLLLAGALLPLTVFGQSNIVITGFLPNGTLTWSNLAPNSTSSVEWASSPDGPWTNTWAHLKDIPTGTNSYISVSVPMFYRVIMVVPETNFNIGWCRLQWPLDVTVAEDESFEVYGRVYIAGLTDQADGVDTHPAVVAQVGYGPDGSDPTSAGWVWSAATANPAWSGSSAGEPNNDEYMATLSVAQAGTYDFAVRFSGDGGKTWLLGDRNAGPGSDGSEDGYQVGNAGSLLVNAGSFLVTEATATSSVTVIVGFNATINPATVLSDASQFAFSGGLTAVSAIASGAQVTVTTSTQNPQEYTVTVTSTIQDDQGRPLDASANTAVFTGF